MADLLETEALKSETVEYPHSKPRRVRLFQSVFILNITYLACGTLYAWSSPVLVKLQLSDSEGSTVASMMVLGNLLGPFVTGLMLNSLGRKYTVCTSMVVMTLSYLVLSLDTSFLQLSIGRFLSGAALGIIFSSVPIYIAEISEDSARGFLNTLLQIFSSFGSVLVYAIGPFVSYTVLHYVLLGVCVLFFLLFPLLPNSPYQLIMNNEVDRARDSLTWLRENRSPAAVEKELLHMQKSVQQDLEEKGTVMDLITSVGNRRALVLCITLLGFLQFSGVPIVFFYMEKIFIMSGTNLASSTCSTVTGAILLISSFICPFSVKYYGYKIPLLASALGMALGMGGIGLFFLLKFHSFNVDSLGWTPLLSVILFITAFNTGFANIPIALMGELFPSNVRHIAATMIITSSGVGGFFIIILFPDLIQLIGLHYVFLSCALSNFIGVIYVILKVQDTSGLSFGEIQELLNGPREKDIQMKPVLGKEDFSL